MTWKASPVAAYEIISAKGLAPRSSAASRLSRTRIPAPSPNTNPSRCASKGREAFVGSSFLSDSALHELNPAITIGVIDASVPPAIAVVAIPSRIIPYASPIASAPVLHAVTGQLTGPRAPSCIDTCPAARLPSIMGIKNGLTRPGPFSFIVSYCSTRVVIPPIPLPTTTATWSLLVSSILREALLTASLAATTANCANRSIRLASLRPSAASGSKSTI